MSENEYLMEVMSKVDKFNDWVAQYQEVYSSNNNDIITGMFVAFVISFLCMVVKLSLDEDSKDSKDSKTLGGAIFVSMPFIILIIMMLKTASHIGNERYLENAKITLDDLEKVKPINFNKLPDWVKYDLTEEGYIKCEDIYRVFRDKEVQENRDATNSKRLEQIERISGGKNDW
jgi:hypothetical protein